MLKQENASSFKKLMVALFFISVLLNGRSAIAQCVEVYPAGDRSTYFSFLLSSDKQIQLSSQDDCAPVVFLTVFLYDLGAQKETIHGFVGVVALDFKNFDGSPAVAFSVDKDRNGATETLARQVQEFIKSFRLRNP